MADNLFIVQGHQCIQVTILKLQISMTLLIKPKWSSINLFMQRRWAMPYMIKIKHKIGIYLYILMKNYSYLTPPSRVHSKNIDHSIISESFIQKKLRHAYQIDSSEYTQEELESLHRLRQYLKHKNPSKNYPDSLLLKYCHLGQFMTSNSKDYFQYYEDWMEMQACSKNVEKGILHSGVFYSFGRDEKFCPTIYFNPQRIDLQKYTIQDYLVCLRTLLEPIEEHMMIPGKTQKWNIVVDLRDFNEKRFQNQHEVVLKNFKKICYAYPYRLKRIFLIEKRYSAIWSSPGNVLVNKIVDDLKLTKYCVRIIQLHDLNRYIPVLQRQKQYGGNLDDLYEFWPIQTTNRLTEMNSRLMESQQSSDYGSIENERNAEFFKEGEQKSPLCDFKKMCNIF